MAKALRSVGFNPVAETIFNLEGSYTVDDDRWSPTDSTELMSEAGIIERSGYNYAVTEIIKRLQRKRAMKGRCRG